MSSVFRTSLLRLSAIALSALVPAVVYAAPPPGYCDVRVCNKLERFSLDPFKHMKDSFGKTCMPAVLGKQDAVAGKVLDKSSRWYQGSFNPTKSSVTRVESVGTCTPEASPPPQAASPASAASAARKG